MTYTVSYEDEGTPDTDTAEDLDGILNRAADLAISGVVVLAVDGPDGPVPLDLVDDWVYRKLAADNP